tara:strand:- start:72 stop:401 length:330 start_codon:yes stop_codon:yes gene_type:complete
MFRVLFIIFLFVSCNTSSNESSVISNQKFTKIIVDIHLIEAKFENQKIEDEFKANAILQNEYDSIFNFHNITYENFQNSLKHYSLEKNELEMIYTNALETIKKEKSKLD